MIDNLYTFDCEVTAYDWLFVFKDYATKTYYEMHNDNDAVAEFMRFSPVLAGFNNKHYDNFILRAVLSGFSPEQVKEINDLIIVEQINGWNIPVLREQKIYFESFDLMDDCEMGTSLKSIEGHLGIPIRESSIDFTIQTRLTDAQVKEMFQYCRYDVDSTEILLTLRKDYLQNKINLGRERNLSDAKSLYMTNAGLTAEYLRADKTKMIVTDERDYEYPDKLLREYIPKEVFEFFDRMKDKSLTNDEVFKSSLEIMVGNCPCTLAYGGIHGAIPNYVEEETATRKIRNKDVASYYPHLMTIPLSEGKEFGYTSRAIPDARIYIKALEDRVEAKRTGNKAKNLALKLVLNTTYGCMGSGSSIRNPDGSYTYTPRNNLYDPLMCRSVCVSGQLLLLELSCHLIAECPSIQIIQLNTDGIMVSLDDTDEAKYQEITQEWQERTGFELEEDFIHKIVQKDVNNYVEIPIDGEPKVKGTALVRGVLTNGKIDFKELGYADWNNLNGGAFKINNSACVVSKAIIEYFKNGTTPEETILTETDIMMFQIISKASSKYSGAYQIVDGEKVPIQKVNRVYATTDTLLGTLYKIHAETGGAAKQAGLPTHCIIDNENRLQITDIDKQWYIKLATQRINEFLGVKPPKKNTRKINSLKKKSLELLSII